MLTLSSRLISLLDRLDDTDSNGLPHVTYGETTERWVLVVSFNTHGLRRNEFDNAGITGLDKLGRVFKGLATPAVDLLHELSKFASNVSSVTVEHWSITSPNLSRVVEDNDLGSEGGCLLGGIILGVRGNVPTTNILDGDVPIRHVSHSLSSRVEDYTLDVEADVVTW